MTTLKRSARLLMCAPEHFAVSYAINPWMDPASWARDNRAHAAAAREWTDLHHTLAGLGAGIDLVLSVPGLPDLAFPRTPLWCSIARCCSPVSATRSASASRCI